MKSVDVVVVGAGFAGICAARDLLDAGRSVVIVEARSRIGGRTFTDLFPGTPHPVEMGGTWVSPKHQPFVTREIERYRLKLARSRPAPTHFAWAFQNRVSAEFPIVGEAIYDLERALLEFINESHRIEIDIPRDQQDLADLDIPLSEFLDRLEVHSSVRQFLEAWAALGSGALPSEWSALTALSWIAALGNSAWAWYAAVAEEFELGTQAVLENMLGDSGAKLMLSCPAVSILQGEDTVTVITDRQEALSARHAIVATPIAIWRDIEWNPPLSRPKAIAAANPHRGRMRKFWMEVSNAPTDVVGFGDGSALLWVSTEHELKSTQLMVGFSAPHSPIAEPVDQSLQAALTQYFPDARLLTVAEHDWRTDPFSKGTWMCHRPGHLSTLSSAVQEMEGRVAFATADIATRWIGWIDGALESGTRAARDILAAS